MPTFPVTLPDQRITKGRFGISFNQSVFESPATRQVQTVSRLGDMWEGLYTLPIMNETQAAVWTGFLTSLRGMVGTFYAFDSDRARPTTFVDNSPIRADSTTIKADSTTVKADDGNFPGNVGHVDGGGQTGRTLLVKNLPASSTVAKAGDYFEVETRYHKLVADATTNGSGAVTLQFEPPLRSSPVHNAALDLNSPRMIARLTSPDFSWESDHRKLTSISFAFEEVL